MTWWNFADVNAKIFACIALYYLFRVRHFSLAKGPARIADLIFIQGFRRLLARHVEPTPPGKEAERHRVF